MQTHFEIPYLHNVFRVAGVQRDLVLKHRTGEDRDLRQCCVTSACIRKRPLWQHLGRPGNLYQRKF